MLKTDRAPNFICLGSQKCGTTWLYNNLCKHPECSMPLVKELRYFYPWYQKNELRNFHPLYGQKLSLELYRNSFGSKISGDITPEYFNHSNNPEFIKQTFPNIKLFVILRNPVDRAFSQYRMEKYTYSNIPKNQTFLESFNSNFQNMKNRGLYCDHLNHFLKYFDLNKNIKVYFFDDLVRDQKKFFFDICDYINISKFDTGMFHSIDSSQNHEKITKNDYMQVWNYYKKSMRNLEDILDKKIAWH